jgi:DNA-binding response OmpR family regulator
MNADYKVAVIEDEPSIRILYQTKLELEGFVVQTAADGLSGMELVESFQPHLALLDLRMPGMNGDEMLQHAVSGRRAGTRRITHQIKETWVYCQPWRMMDI